MFPCNACLRLWLRISEAGSQSSTKALGAGLGEESRWALQEEGRAQRTGALGLLMLLLAGFPQREDSPKDVEHSFENA